MHKAKIAILKGQTDRAPKGDCACYVSINLYGGGGIFVHKPYAID